MKEEIRALSWKQPYASLMLHGKIETRTWSTKYRGKVLICASKKPYSGIEVMKISGVEQAYRLNNKLRAFDIEEPIGVAIAIGELVDCRPMAPQDEDKCFVQYREGLWCHIYKNVKPINLFEWKGTQGWKILDEETKSKIKIID